MNDKNSISEFAPAEKYDRAVNMANESFYRDKLFLSQYSSVIFYSFMELLDIENKNITTIIEGLRYSLEPSEIEKMLII